MCSAVTASGRSFGVSALTDPFGERALACFLVLRFPTVLLLRMSSSLESCVRRLIETLNRKFQSALDSFNEKPQ
jgi:hypothetical protein